jgi:hypothetical protein
LLDEELEFEVNPSEGDIVMALQARVVSAEEQIPSEKKKNDRAPSSDADQFPQAPKEVATEAETLWNIGLSARKASEVQYAVYEECVEKLTPIIIKHGAHTKPKAPQDSILIVGGFKLWNLGTSRSKWTEMKGIAFLKAQIAELEEKVQGKGKDKKEATEKLSRYTQLFSKLVIQKEDIDWDAWASLDSAGNIPEEVRTQMVQEGNITYSFRSFELEGQLCPSCKEEISKKDKFCSHCGHKTEKK